MIDLKAEVSELWSELSPAIEGVLKSGAFVGGAVVERFEREAADYLGAKHALGLNSGTDALILGLEALGVGPGDEVITTPYSFFATSEAILRLGATPVFVDVEPATLNMDVSLVEAAIAPATKVILPVHLFGLPLNMAALRQLADLRGLLLVEDSAQAFGATTNGKRVGTFGSIGAYSFYPTKNLGAYGDAGLITTNDDDLAELLFSLRNHGSSRAEKYLHERLGHNSRLDAIQAAVLSVKLRHLESFTARRRERAAAYRQALAHLPQGEDALTLPPESPAHIYHQFTVQLPRPLRERAEVELKARGVAFSRFYPVPLTTQPAGADFGRAPVAERAAGRALSLPIHPWLPDAAIEAVLKALEATLL